MSHPNIPFRQLGKNGPMVPAVGLGLMGLSIHYGPAPSDEERFAVLDRALEIGARNWDSSDMYGDNEELLGKWFKRTGKRDQIFLATKFGFIKGSHADIDSSAGYCKKACAESLKALGVDCIDLYYMHRANAKTPIEDTMRGMLELKAEGKIKHIGLSEISSQTLRRACKVGQVDAVQVEYSPFELGIEGESGTNLMSTCRELGVAIVAYSPLGRGLLAGNLEGQNSISAEGDWRSLYPWFTGENFAANLDIVRQLKVLAGKKGCSPAQLVIAWVLRQGQDVIPIPGTKKIKYLEENLGALQVELTDEEEGRIRDIVSGVAGERAPAFVKSQLYVDTVEE
ncbi:putative aldo/keto reductase [Truncatella angustata]|uniref:Aldo/keto reductase n=1 Tax=Truncatella angustata TaxID=152316 RepID=A0A9P8UHS6_9PEZI|nr:putative aldo/keto reductase [Truncatella angustata]KAH6652464.1 putative aldo/keto reductase [Truncatella angustata]